MHIFAGMWINLSRETNSGMVKHLEKTLQYIETINIFKVFTLPVLFCI